MAVKRRLNFASARKSKKVRMNALINATSKPSYFRANRFTAVVPGTPQILTSSGAGVGLINTDIGANPASFITAWTTRFGSTFDEARVNKIQFELYPLGIYTGVTAFFISEEALSSVTLSEATERPARYVKNNEQSAQKVIITWKSKDFSDSTWRSVQAFGYAPCHLNIYTDNANFNSPASTVLWMIRPIFYMEFRGLASN